MNKKMSREKKQAKTDAMLKNCYDRFLSFGIGNSKMTELANSCEIGVATLYRYFEEKGNIVIAVADYIWRMKLMEFAAIRDESVKKNLSGYEIFANVINHFSEIAEKDPQFFTYLDAFNDYCKGHVINREALIDYKNTMNQLGNLFNGIEAIGKKDESIRSNVNLWFIYVAVCNSVFGLTESIRSGLCTLPENTTLSIPEQVKITVKLVLDYIKA